MFLNRWHNILPYDSTRVVILPPNSANNQNNEVANSGLQTDYINANHIRYANIVSLQIFVGYAK